MPVNFKSCSPGCSSEVLARRSGRIQETLGVTQVAEKQNISLGFLWLRSSEVTVHVTKLPQFGHSVTKNRSRTSISKSPTEEGEVWCLGAFCMVGRQGNDVHGFIWGLLHLVKMKGHSKLLPALSTCSVGGWRLRENQ